MTTSGSTDFTTTRLEIIRDALELIGVAGIGKTITAEESESAAYDLNSITKHLQSLRVFLWTVEWETKTFTASSQVTGTDGLIYTCSKGHTSSSDDKPITGTNYTTYWTEEGATGGAWANTTSYTSIGDFYPPVDTRSLEKAF